MNLCMKFDERISHHVDVWQWSPSEANLIAFSPSWVLFELRSNRLLESHESMRKFVRLTTRKRKICHNRKHFAAQLLSQIIAIFSILKAKFLSFSHFYNQNYFNFDDFVDEKELVLKKKVPCVCNYFNDAFFSYAQDYVAQQCAANKVGSFVIFVRSLWTKLQFG